MLHLDETRDKYLAEALVLLAERRDVLEPLLQPDVLKVRLHTRANTNVTKEQTRANYGSKAINV